MIQKKRTSDEVRVLIAGGGLGDKEKRSVEGCGFTYPLTLNA